jgi:transcriptional regulator with XRE-family HTH domain
LREDQRISQERLAQLANLDRTYVSGIERGERNPSLENLLRLADALGVSLLRDRRASRDLPASIGILRYSLRAPSPEKRCTVESTRWRNTRGAACCSNLEPCGFS